MKTILEKLFGAYNKTASDGAAEAYVEALADLPVDAVDQAVRVLVRSARFLPTPAELRTEAVKYRPEAPPDPDKSTPLAEPKVIDVGFKRLVVTREWYDDCDVCRDSGWQPFWCPGGVDAVNPTYDNRTRPCGRTHRECESGHEFVARCACYQSNPTIQRRLGKGRRAA